MRGSIGRVLVLALLAAACGGSRSGPRSADSGSLHGALVGANVDPTVRPARLFPEAADERTSYGSEAGGGSRLIVAGLRVVASPAGAIVAAEDRLPSPPQSTVALPERLGGGFLFLIGTTLWRAERWLAPARPIFTSSQPVQGIIAGLDRVYVRGSTSVVAIDATTGRALDLGPWPASPFVASYAAADGWRAAAVADMRGVVATFDAGATWRTLDLPIDPKLVAASSDNLAVGGIDAQRAEAWYELRADGSVTRLAAAPRDVKTKLVPGAPTKAPPGPSPTPATTLQRSGAGEDKEDFAAKTFGKRPLAAAIEDGWPLSDGTAVIARDGSLGRVRLGDGKLVDVVREAFPLKGARCHPVPLSRPSAPGAFGFVCGEPRGTTAIYTYDPRRGQLAELKRFDKPRVVVASGNGALAVRGPCAVDAEPTPPPRPDPVKLEKSDDRSREPAKAGQKGKDGQSADAKPADRKTPEPKEPPRAASIEVHPYCVLAHDETWREVHVRSDGTSERVVVLSDGRVVVVSPPQAIGTPARLTVLERSGQSRTLAVTFPRVSNEVARVLRLGFWLDGFEERRPGVVGGWIEAGGTMVGIELALDGTATLGQYIRDAGLPFVSGRYGLGWTASRRGFETTDGGMTWSSIDLPDPLVPTAKVDRRACGPVGCLAHGWLRVGWGSSKSPPPPPTPAPYRAPFVPSSTSLQLSCEPLASQPPTPAPPKRAAARPATPSVSPASPRIHFGTFGSTPVLGSFNGLSELPPFFWQSAPVMRDSDRGINVDVRELLDRYPNMGSLARIYGWGPRTGDWDTQGRWQVKWQSPFAGWPELRASLPSRPPQMILDVTHAGGSSFGGFALSSNNFQLVPGDDAAHALLIAKRQRSEVLLFELEAERAPVEVHRADGEPFGEIEGVVRAAGLWFAATQAPAGSGSATVIWQIEGGVARELTRVPRAHSETNPNARARLARRTDGRAIALVVESQQAAERPANMRWALPIDLETAARGEPEALGYVDLGDRKLELCTDDLAGWVLDATLPSASIHLRLPRASGSLSSMLARLRLTSTRACLERVAGNFDGIAGDGAQHLTTGAPRPERARAPLPNELIVTAAAAQSRFPLRCLAEKPSGTTRHDSTTSRAPGPGRP